MRNEQRSFRFEKILSFWKAYRSVKQSSKNFLFYQEAVGDYVWQVFTVCSKRKAQIFQLYFFLTLKLDGRPVPGRAYFFYLSKTTIRSKIHKKQKSISKKKRANNKLITIRL